MEDQIGWEAMVLEENGSAIRNEIRIESSES